MTATRTLAKKTVKNFFEKSVREGKKVENATPRNESREARFLRTQRRGPFRIGAGFPVARVLRPAARVLKKPTFAAPSPKNETRSASASRSNRIDRRAERDARRSASERRSYYRFSTNFVNGGRRLGASRRTGARQLKVGSFGTRLARFSSSAASLYCLILLYIVFSLTPSLRAARRRQPLQATSVSRKARRSI